VLAILVLALAGHSPCRASGSYRPSIPPRSSAESIDRELYNLGRAILLGKIPLTKKIPASAVPAQEARLRQLQEKLPKSVRDTTNLPRLAPFLSASDIQALEYYLLKRYQISLPPS
jgi:hypothetical protein